MFLSLASDATLRFLSFLFSLLHVYLKQIQWIVLLHKMLPALERAEVGQQRLQRLPDYKSAALKHQVSFYLSLKKLQD